MDMSDGSGPCIARLLGHWLVVGASRWRWLQCAGSLLTTHSESSGIPMEVAKQQAYELLTELGYAVEDIPEADKRRADLRVSDLSSTYFIEVKQKLDDTESLRADAERMVRGEVVTHTESVSQNNRVDAILKDGCDQLDQTPKGDDDFALIWFAADGLDRNVYRQRAFATYYGFVQLIALDPPSDRVVDCFYFDFSASWSMRSVDAMVLVDGDGLQLCLNEFSPRIATFRESDLCVRLSTGVVDPVKLAADGSIISLHSDVSRKSESAVLNELFRQTGVRYMAVRPQQHSASATV